MWETIRYDLSQKNNKTHFDTNNILGDVNDEFLALTRD